MTKASKMEYYDEIIRRYTESDKYEKGTILDEYCKVCGYNRKYAIRKLSSKLLLKPKVSCKIGRPKKYCSKAIETYIMSVWKTTNLICSKRLKVPLLEWLEYYEAENETDKLTEEDKKLVMQISASTIDRLLASHRNRYQKRGLSTTKPGSIIREMIPIKTNQWEEFRPGYFEADTVVHCGGSLSGTMAYTIDLVDIATGWTAQRAVLGKGETAVLEAIADIESDLPFKILGFDSDNGSEFINWHLYKYLTKRKRPVSYTRSRPYKKNDNAHIEQKNWTIVRQYMGYDRIETHKAVEKMNKLYRNELTMFLNYFIPSVKLISKNRVGSKQIRKHDKAKTPYQRMQDSKFIKKETKQILKQIKARLNPFELNKRIQDKIREIQNLSVYN
jgi:hypothetical protein